MSTRGLGREGWGEESERQTSSRPARRGQRSSGVICSAENIAFRMRGTQKGAAGTVRLRHSDDSRHQTHLGKLRFAQDIDCFFLDVLPRDCDGLDSLRKHVSTGCEALHL
eukprot:6190196-Pleurochrysis_carterae.AAC.1